MTDIKALKELRVPKPLTPAQEKAISTEINHLKEYIANRSGQGATAGAMVEAMKRMIERMTE